MALDYRLLWITTVTPPAISTEQYLMWPFHSPLSSCHSRQCNPDPDLWTKGWVMANLWRTKQLTHICFICLEFCCGKVTQKHTMKNQSINSFLPITRDQWKTTPRRGIKIWCYEHELWNKPRFGLASWFYHCLTSMTLSKLFTCPQPQFPHT